VLIYLDELKRKFEENIDNLKKLEIEFTRVKGESEYNKKQLTIVEAAKTTSDNQILELRKEIEHIKDEIFGLKTDNHRLKIQAKGKFIWYRYLFLDESRRKTRANVDPNVATNSYKRSHSKEMSDMQQKVKKELEVITALKKKMTIMNFKNIQGDSTDDLLGR